MIEKQWHETETNLKALKELLYQLADDDFIHAFRGSEWLGLAPHIEEDVAFSSINQDTMGHAALYYHHLEELGEGNANDISHLREPIAYRNAVLLEEKNGEGEYQESPHYDWAFTVIRHLFYDMAKKIRLDSMKHASYEPLSHIAKKISTEQTYHLMHWETWFKQLMLSTTEARKRMESAIERVWDDLEGLLVLGPLEEDMVQAGLIEHELLLKERFLTKVRALFEQVNYRLDQDPKMLKGNGRIGEHTTDLNHALNILSEVYRSNPVTSW